ncbi:MAG: PLD nuclease N-terminal domain-containing protein [Microbacteriaceae bacterium]
MSRVLVLLTVVELAFLVFAFVDVLLLPPARVRALPKPVWAIIVLLLSPVGGILWFVLGRAPAAPRRETRPLAPDDDPEFLRRIARKPNAEGDDSGRPGAQ